MQGLYAYSNQKLNNILHKDMTEIFMSQTFLKAIITMPSTSAILETILDHFQKTTTKITRSLVVKPIYISFLLIVLACRKKNDNKTYHFPSLSWKPIRNQEHTILHSCFIKTKQTLRKRKKTQCILNLDHFLGNQTKQKRKDKNIRLKTHSMASQPWQLRRANRSRTQCHRKRWKCSSHWKGGPPSGSYRF